MLSDCNEFLRNSEDTMTDHEESFLKDFFTHVANLGFDKAKELVVSNFINKMKQVGERVCDSMGENACLRK
jgi:hypothetical protein